MREVRDLVALGCRVLGAAGHGDLVWGHLSARDPGILKFLESVAAPQ